MNVPHRSPAHRGGRLVLGVALAAALPASALGQAVTLDDGGVNTINAASDDVLVTDSVGGAPTTLNVVDGAVISAPIVTDPDGDDVAVTVAGASVLNFSGGQILGNIALSDTATATISGTASAPETTDAAGEDFGGEFVVGGMAFAEHLGGEVFNFAVEDDATGTVNGGSIDDDLDVAGNGVLTFLDGFVNDDVDAEDSGVMNLLGGVFDEDVEAADSSEINISGGEFTRIFSNDANLVSSGGTINVTGGVFGTDVDEVGGGVFAAAGGQISFANAEISGAATDTAVPATFGASLNASIAIENVEFNSLAVSALTGGSISLTDVDATDLTVEALGGIIAIEGGSADTLEISTDFGSDVTIAGGDFDDANFVALGGSTVRIIGDNFVVNGLPVDEGELLFISGTIEGTLADGSAFSTTFARQFAPAGDAATVVLVKIPEPASMALAAAACGLLIGGARRREAC